MAGQTNGVPASLLATLGVRSCLCGYDDVFGLGRSVASDGTIHVDPVTVKNPCAR